MGKLNETELVQVESHMSIVHAIAIQLTQIAARAEQLVLIIDLKGIKVKVFSNKTINGAIKNLATLCGQYFPEILHKAYIVNAPMAFSQYWDTISLLLPPDVAAKFHVTGSSTDPEIQHYVSRSANPVGNRQYPARNYGRVVEAWRDGRGALRGRGRRKG